MSGTTKQRLIARQLRARAAMILESRSRLREQLTNGVFDSVQADETTKSTQAAELAECAGISFASALRIIEEES